jgi:SET domain-containing protein
MGTMKPDSIVFVADSAIHGKGLFAKTFIPAGTVIGTLSGKRTTRDGAHVLWLDDGTGFRVTCELRYINHSKSPNAAYYDSLEVCAIRDIQAGEEITHDYGDDWVD